MGFRRGRSPQGQNGADQKAECVDKGKSLDRFPTCLVTSTNLSLPAYPIFVAVPFDNGAKGGEESQTEDEVDHGVASWEPVPRPDEDTAVDDGEGGKDFRED